MTYLIILGILIFNLIIYFMIFQTQFYFFIYFLNFVFERAVRLVTHWLNQ
jgi:hypothetical protein